MSNLKVSKNKEFFEYKGEKFFYLGDTVWSAFTQTTLEEWEEYLDYRKKQGFNVLQIAILPLDRSLPDLDIIPFIKDKEGKWDFFKFNNAYFEKAERMLQLAVEKGFIPALVVLFCDYVEGTWATKGAMPLEAVKPYAEKVVEVFEKFDPIYLISGDTDFREEISIDYYLVALKTIRELSPESIITLHLAANLTHPPEVFLQEGLIDFYMYQSSHKLEDQQAAYLLPEEFCGKSPKLPIINGEPCYEGCGHWERYGRFNEFDVRKASWQSILAGGKAGITYGAHGIWSWHKKGDSFPAEFFSKVPYDWRTALKFPGAFDISYLKWIFETYDLFDINPWKSILNDTEEIRAAKNEEGTKIILYIPYSIDVLVDGDLSDYKLVMINLADRYVTIPEISVSDNKTTIKMADINRDYLVIGIKKCK